MRLPGPPGPLSGPGLVYAVAEAALELSGEDPQLRRVPRGRVRVPEVVGPVVILVPLVPRADLVPELAEQRELAADLSQAGLLELAQRFPDPASQQGLPECRQQV